MTPLPKKKHTRGQSNRKVKNMIKKSLTLVKCGSCGKLKFPHQVCPACGAY